MLWWLLGECTLKEINPWCLQTHLIYNFLKFSLWQIIFFAGTKLSSVHSGAFCGLENLEEINLSKNKLTTPPELLPVKRTLRTLFLAENKIDNFPPAYFDGFEILRHVNIADNELYSVPHLGDIGHCLEVFTMDSNLVKSLDGMTGGINMNKLRKLGAINNTINHFNTSMLTLTAKLFTLDLRQNQLRYLADPTPYISPSNRLNKKLNSNKKLSVGDNRMIQFWFHCEIHLQI